MPDESLTAWSIGFQMQIQGCKSLACLGLYHPLWHTSALYPRGSCFRDLKPSQSRRSISSSVTSEDIPAFKSACLQVCRVAKLFAKHFKIEEQSKDLQSRCVNIATGTPHRLSKLVECGSLRLDRLKLLVLDAALDAKQRQALVCQILHTDKNAIEGLPPSAVIAMSIPRS